MLWWWIFLQRRKRLWTWYNMPCEALSIRTDPTRWLSSTLCTLLDFPIHNDISMGLPIVHFEGSQVEFSKCWCLSVSEGGFHFNKQSRPWWNAALCSFHLGLNCLPKYMYPFRGCIIQRLTYTKKASSSWRYISILHDHVTALSYGQNKMLIS